MNITALDNLVRWKLKVSGASSVEDNIITSIRRETLRAVCKKFPWSFLERKSETITLSAGDYQKGLPGDFLSVIGVRVKDSENVIYPVHSFKPMEWEESNPDTDDTDRPHRYWIYYDETTKKFKIEFRDKANASFTVILRYHARLSDDEIDSIPNGLVLFYGIMSALSPPEEMALYNSLYETTLQQMWEDDIIDLGDETTFKEDERIKVFNEYMDSIS